MADTNHEAAAWASQAPCDYGCIEARCYSDSCPVHVGPDPRVRHQGFIGPCGHGRDPWTRCEVCDPPAVRA